MNETYFARSRRSAVNGLLIAALMLVTGWLMVNARATALPGGVYTYFMLSLPLGFFILVAATYLLLGSSVNLLRSRYGFLISADGIQVFSAFWPFGLIPWTNIEHVSWIKWPESERSGLPLLRQLKSGHDIILSLKSPEVLLQTRNPWQRLHIQLNQKHNYGTVFIASQTWIGNSEEAEKLVSRYYETYKRQSTAPVQDGSGSGLL